MKSEPVGEARNDVEEWLEREGSGLSGEFWASLLTLDRRLRSVGELSVSDSAAVGSAGLTLVVPKAGPTIIDGSAAACEEHRCVEFYFSMFHQAPGTMTFDSWAADAEVSVDCRCDPPCEGMHHLEDHKTITDGPELAVQAMSEHLETFLEETVNHGIGGWLRRA